MDLGGIAGHRGGSMDDYCVGSSASVLFRGGVHEFLCIMVRRGMKQGCPASGSAWARLYDCVIRRLVAVLPPVGYSLTCYADDLAASMLDIRVGVSRLMPVLLELRLAAGLTIRLGKTQVVLFGTSTDFSVKRVQQDIPWAGGFAVARRGTYLGILIGPDAYQQGRDKACSMFRARSAYVRSLPGHLGDRLRAYQSFAVCVALFVAQFMLSFVGACRLFFGSLRRLSTLSS